MPVDSVGRLDISALRSAVAAHAGISVMWANNEVGTLQPVREIAVAAYEEARSHTATRFRRSVTSKVDFAAIGVGHT